LVSIHRRNAGWQGGGSCCVIGGGEQGSGPPFLRRSRDSPLYENLDVADELLAPDFAWKLPGKDAGIEDYKRWVAKQPASSSDLHFSIEEQIAGGVKVITRLIDSGSHDQEEYPGGGGCLEEATASWVH
jgi:hypothetical protein